MKENDFKYLSLKYFKQIIISILEYRDYCTSVGAKNTALFMLGVATSILLLNPHMI